MTFLVAGSWVHSSEPPSVVEVSIFLQFETGGFTMSLASLSGGRITTKEASFCRAVDILNSKVKSVGLLTLRPRLLFPALLTAVTSVISPSTSAT